MKKGDKGLLLRGPFITPPLFAPFALGIVAFSRMNEPLQMWSKRSENRIVRLVRKHPVQAVSLEPVKLISSWMLLPKIEEYELVRAVTLLSAGSGCCLNPKDRITSQKICCYEIRNWVIICSDAGGCKTASVWNQRWGRLDSAQKSEEEAANLCRAVNMTQKTMIGNITHVHLGEQRYVMLCCRHLFLICFIQLDFI